MIFISARSNSSVQFVEINFTSRVFRIELIFILNRIFIFKNIRKSDKKF